MATAIVFVAPAGDFKMDLTGKYLMVYDPDGANGRGVILSTNDIGMAMQFPSVREALECWKQVSAVKPLRPDGKPNRPLTAYTVTFEEV